MDWQGIVQIAAVTTIALTLGIWIGGWSGQLKGELEVKTEAVEVGVAEWYIKDSAGTRGFRWITERGEE